MKAKIKAIYNLILPNTKTNYIILILFILGFLSGTFFLTIISTDEKTIIINQITNFVANINNNTLNSLSILKNSLTNNLIYIAVLWILGLSIIGIILNIFLVYLKGFVLGFTLSSIILTYKVKGLLFSFIYLVPSELLNILIIIVLGVYSLTLSTSIIKEITKKKGNNLRKVFKRYLVVLFLSIIIAIISSLFESFLLPNLLNFFY